ncbi:ABC transporter permease [Geodermatophilus obscurus]|uniref:Putative exporter of polyketide antibiotics-like protein n=1 Tax=Geodermatophilus obscurus (strain ATCC 25078 / DSM 43160 / JCM 3152 / CCUG 61914 / KCC A-0152 / KCTC 9177 / NBRC 13315 / NRRL B-3577 / G-20) TaxID=526225 RepID=D2S7T0_GEOOG|nr:exporter of polyketide antibiotics-like protein [Geodermatophilus obscurus]ADB75539.1 putative exporter of polyketide antibiotics-like protein [Geodermatophilus obscurus DSM 43160]
MTTRTAPTRAPAVTGPQPPRSAGRTVTTAALRQVRRGTLIVAIVCAGMSALVVVQYRSLGGALGTASLTALAENPAIRTLFGPPVALDDAGGFTVWRVGTGLAALVGIWAALTVTRLTRGDEEARRCDLLLGGRLRVRSLVALVLGVVLAAAATAGAATAIAMVLAGAAVTGSVLFGACLAGTGMVGAALGCLAAQLLPERRSASGLAVAVLLGSLLARMVADGAPVVGWLSWASPFGLLGRVGPFADDRVLPLLVLAGLAAAPAAAAIRMASGRDLGGARLAGPDRRTAPSRLLRSLPGLAVHRTRRPLMVWTAGLMTYFVVIGLLATSMTSFLRDNPAFARMAAQAGFAQLGSVEGYVSALYALLAIPIGSFAAARIAALATDETAGRLALLYALPVSRTRWAATEAAAVAAAVVVLAAAAGLATWAGASRVDAGPGLGEALAGALSVVPAALLCLGAALAALGWARSAVLAVGVLPAAGGFLLLVLADTLGWPGAIRWFSPFAHLSAVPAEPWNAAGAAGMLAVATLLAWAGCRRYGHRDLTG